MDEVTTRQQSPEVVVAQGDLAPAPMKKVELDLDDAPFLQKEEPIARQEEFKEEAVPEEDTEKKKGRKKLLILIGAASIAVIAVAAALAWWFFFRTPPPLPPEAPRPDVVVVPSAVPVSQPTDLVTEFKPFIVPTVEGGQTRFLVCKFSAITKEPAVEQEMETQRIPLRDAIYYYLRSKDSPFLLDSRNAHAIKQDLLSIFNDYLSHGTVEDVVFESYLSH